MLWFAAATVATLWALLALTWLAVLVPLAGRGPAQGQARQPTDDPRGEAPGPDSNANSNQ